MEYGAYLIAVFLNHSDEVFRDLEHDLQYEKAIALYKEFVESEFNNESKTEYDCISEFLNELKK